ncbi:TIGR02569 family protein [Glycomyces paridis]|uniref:TIGR02569 family protein n=1 Tax=Glycomyces paridis TaxID=2126555 RepID=A0A4S8PAM4_9ACTN|nr:TIGR02569 family protein [Glycomyces paridis]THV27310.1 TIGR02569 family protein [Glycomyces paridis]
MRTPPPPEVVAAFGGDAPVPLQGGQGETWLAGTVVLKPAWFAAESRWRASILAALPETGGFGVARPVRAASGDWLHSGWEAWRHVPGRTDPTRWDEAVAAGGAFHEAIAGTARPDFLDERDNRWTRADRASWDLAHTEAEPLTARLLAARRPVSARPQLVHGDLLGNLVYAPGSPPTVIDWAPYWRPASWAAAVTVVDALCWHGAGGSLVERWSAMEEWTQMLLRAMLFRMLTDAELERGSWRPHPAYAPVAALLLARADP